MFAPLRLGRDSKLSALHKLKYWLGPLLVLSMAVGKPFYISQFYILYPFPGESGISIPTVMTKNTDHLYANCNRPIMIIMTIVRLYCSYDHHHTMLGMISVLLSTACVDFVIFQPIRVQYFRVNDLRWLLQHVSTD